MPPVPGKGWAPRSGQIGDPVAEDRVGRNTLDIDSVTYTLTDRRKDMRTAAKNRTKARKTVKGRRKRMATATAKYRPLPIPAFFDPENAKKWEYSPDQPKALVEAG